MNKANQNPISLKLTLPWLSDLNTQQTIWLAYSGGVDSHVLLHLLASELRARQQLSQLRAIHINHGLQPQAEQWAQHCVHICQQLAVECQIIAVKAHPQVGASPEAAAREARYAAFAHQMKAGDYLLTAHHQDDQTETFLLQLLRGAGLKGLAAMPLSTPFANGIHLRPLLAYSRQELMSYALAKNLQWIEDESNANTQFDRNFVRQEIVPRIQQRWPAVTKVVGRVVQHCAEADQLLTLMAQQQLPELQGTHANTLAISKLRQLEAVQWRNIVRQWLYQRGFSLPSQAQLERIYHDVVWSENDKCPLVRWGGVEIRRYQDDLYALIPLLPHAAQQIWEWDLTQPLVINGVGTLMNAVTQGQGISMEALRGCKLSIRFRPLGVRCQPKGRQGSHPLKKLFQEWGVPPWQRDRVPLLYADEHIAAVVGYTVTQPFAVGPGQVGYSISWQQEMYI